MLLWAQAYESTIVNKVFFFFTSYPIHSYIQVSPIVPIISFVVWGGFLFCFCFFLIHLYWSIIASQYRVSFCCTTKRISHMHTHVPISPASWASLPPSLSHPSRSSQSTEQISLCYGAASHQPTILHSVVYMSMLLSLYPSLALPPHVIKSILCVYLFIPALLLGSSVPFFFFFRFHI